jgi:hypothetical protein
MFCWNRTAEGEDMPMLMTHPTAVAQWHSLVTQAESAADCPLPEPLESYLVFLLMRFSARPELAGKVLALEYLNAVLARGQLQRQHLRDVGDQCLLYSGLFPHQAARRRVKVSYFVDLGRSAYQQLSARLANSYAELYAKLAQNFVSVMDVLHALRRLDGSLPGPEPLSAYQLWADTGSPAAYKILRGHIQGLPALTSTTQVH